MHMQQSQDSTTPWIRLNEMIHEILAALAGYPGDIFIEKNGGFCIAEEVVRRDGQSRASGGAWEEEEEDALLTSAEAEVLTDLLQLGHASKMIAEFTARPCQYGFQAKYPNSASLGNAQFFSKRMSAYDIALSQGLLNELSAYYMLVRELETEALGPKPLSLSAVITKLAPFKQVLPMLKRVVYARSSSTSSSFQCSDELDEGLKAKPLLAVLYSLSHCGDPQCARSIGSLQSYVHGVLYRQLLAWMAYGKLQDMDGDFFIRRNNEKIRVALSGHLERKNTGSRGSGVETGNTPPKYATVKDLLDGLPAVDNADKEQSSDSLAVAEWRYGFELRCGLIPPYMLGRTAQQLQVLFVGKTVRVLRHTLSNDNQPRRGSNSLNKDRVSEVSGSIEDMEEQIHAEVCELARLENEAKVFPREKIIKCCTRLNAMAARRLWSLCVEQAAFLEHLRLLREVFLLGRGDFFRALLDTADSLFRLPPLERTAEFDLQQAVANAKIQSTIEEDEYADLLTFRVGPCPYGSNMSTGPPSTDAAPKQRRPPKLDGWDKIWIEYHPPWPMPLLFTPQLLDRYNILFKLLFNTFRVQHSLDVAWHNAMCTGRDILRNRSGTSERSSSELTPIIMRTLWALLDKVLFLMRNIWFYLQVDVVESNFLDLCNRVELSSDFYELEKLHILFVSNILTQSFLDIKGIVAQLESCFNISTQLCTLVEKICSLQSDRARPEAERERSHVLSEIQRLDKAFSATFNQLFTVLSASKLSSSPQAPYLRQLLLRINFNSYHSLHNAHEAHG